MESISFGGRRVAGFGVGGPINDVIGWWNKAFRANVYDPNVGTSPNPTYQETAKITGQQVDPTAPPDAPAGPTVQQACANIPTALQAIAGCTNANVKPPPGTSVSTTPESVMDAFSKGGIDASGNRIKTPVESAAETLKWLEDHKTAIAVGVAVVGTVVIGGVIYAVARR